jgi:hypothetical protein
MAISARLWFHFSTAVGWFPARTEPVSTHSPSRSKAPEAKFKLRFIKRKHRSVSLLRQRQFRPPDASEARSSGQLMSPTAANRWYL